MMIRKRKHGCAATDDSNTEAQPLATLQFGTQADIETHCIYEEKRLK
jgi:hypothetical protein